MGEGLARLYHQRYGIDFVALRYSAVYGERQHRRAVMGGHIAETCERIRCGQPPIIDGDGRQVQDYVYAGDVARANLMAMESPVTGEGINICAGDGHVAEPHRGNRHAGVRLEPEARVPPDWWSREAAALDQAGVQPRQGQAPAGLGTPGVHRGGHWQGASLGRSTTRKGGVVGPLESRAAVRT